jgi:hypothetical protein
MRGALHLQDDSGAAAPPPPSPTVAGLHQPLVGAQRTVTDSKLGEGFGEKSIGFGGGLALLWNNITGPAMVTLPAVYMNAGWLPATLLLVLMGTCSGFGGGFLIEAMARMPGNGTFGKRIEMMYLAEKLMGQMAYRITVVLFVLNLQLSNIAAIIQSTQTADYTIQEIAGKTCGLEIYPKPKWQCVNKAGGGGGGDDGADGSGSGGAIDAMVSGDSPFGEVWIVSIGFVVVLLITIPLGYWNLDDNIWVQIGAAFLLFVVLAGWGVGFAQPEHLAFDAVEVTGPSAQQRCPITHGAGADGCGLHRCPCATNNVGSQIGPIVFNYAYVVTLPSWVNEMQPGLSVNRQLWGALLPGMVAFVTLGLFSAAYYQTTNSVTDEGIPDSEDLLSGLTGPGVAKLAEVASFVFPPAALISGIPIFSIVIRYNLLESKICSLNWANFWAVVFPWIVALAFYAGSTVNNFVNYVSLISTIPLNLAVPCYLFIRVTQVHPILPAAVGGGYRCVPWLSEAAAVKLAWALIGISVLGNVVAIVFAGLSGGLDWQ